MKPSTCHVHNRKFIRFCPDCKAIEDAQEAHSQALAAKEKAVVDAAVREREYHSESRPHGCSCQICAAVEALLALRGTP